jgi:hypothetical protein
VWRQSICRHIRFAGTSSISRHAFNRRIFLRRIAASRCEPLVIVATLSAAASSRVTVLASLYGGATGERNSQTSVAQADACRNNRKSPSTLRIPWLLADYFSRSSKRGFGRTSFFVALGQCSSMNDECTFTVALDRAFSSALCPECPTQSSRPCGPQTGGSFYQKCFGLAAAAAAEKPSSFFVLSWCFA